MDDLTPEVARTDLEIEACSPVMAELRPHLKRDGFVKTIREMERDGYKLAFLSDGGRVLAVAGSGSSACFAASRFCMSMTWSPPLPSALTGMVPGFLPGLSNRHATKDALSFISTPEFSVRTRIGSTRRMEWLCRGCIFEST